MQAKPVQQARPLARLRCQNLSAAGVFALAACSSRFLGGRGFERTKKAGRDASHFVDGRQKRGLIRLRRLGETADLPHKLQRSRPNLVLSDRRIEVEKGFDVSAHGRGTHIYLNSTAPTARVNLPHHECESSDRDFERIRYASNLRDRRRSGLIITSIWRQSYNYA